MADLFSLQRIAEQNGWAMAGLGITIDIAGLAVLAIIIAQVPRFVALMEKVFGLFGTIIDKIKVLLGGKPQAVAVPEQAPATTSQTVVFDLSPSGITKLAELYKKHTDKLGEAFPLTELYQIAAKEGLPHPHLTIKSLREAGLLAPEGEARFAWKLL